MWKYLLKAVLAVSRNPAVQAWAKKKAREVADRVRHRAEKRMAELHETAGIPVATAKLTRLVRTEKDILRPGQVAIVDGKAVKILRLISSSASETIYEGTEA